MLVLRIQPRETDKGPAFLAQRENKQLGNKCCLEAKLVGGGGDREGLPERRYLSRNPREKVNSCEAINECLAMERGSWPSFKEKQSPAGVPKVNRP